MDATKMIQIEHLSKQFGDVAVLRDINASIAPGEVISVIGPSGTGKSTLLRCLNLLDRPSGGRILINGQNLLAPATDVAALRRFDSSVLAVLLALLRTAPQNDRKWRVLNSFPQFAGLVAIYGLDELLFS